MHSGVKKISLVSLAVGLIATGSVTAAASADPLTEPRPLVEAVENLDGVHSFVVSADRSKVFAISDWGEGAVIDAASRMITGHFPAVENLNSPGSGPTLTQAVGESYALATYDGYALLSFDSGTSEEFVLDPRPGDFSPPNFNAIVADAAGTVTGVTSDGEYLVLDGATVTAATRLFPEGRWPDSDGVTPDGSQYFFTLSDMDPPYSKTTTVIDMATGGVTASLTSADTEDFLPLAFDAAEASLWGVREGDNSTLHQIDLATGTTLSTSSVPNFGGMVLLADAAADWFVDIEWENVGGSLADPSERGSRQLQCCTTAAYRFPDGGDMVYFDVEMRELGFVTAPTITDPTDQPITALGDTVVFTSESEGLALDPNEPGAVEGSPMGSNWQSSPDGTTWTDIPGSTGTTLTVTADETSYPLHYRRHFADPFWGPAPSSQPARMIGTPPAITRPDDLPKGTAGEAYPAETITATGQPGMTWASADLPSRLTINPNTGEITGTTDAAGTFTFTVTVTDIFGTDSRDFTLTVAEPGGGTTPPVITPPGETVTPPTGQGGSSQQLSNTGSNGWAGYATLAGVLVLAGTAGLIASRKHATTER